MADFLSSDKEKEEDEDSVTTADLVAEDQESESSSYNERGLSDEDRSNLYRVLEAGGGPWNFHQNKAFKKATHGQTALFGSDRSRRRKQFLSRISYVRGDRGYSVASYVKELRALGIPPSTNTLDKLHEEAISPSVPKPKSSKASSTPLKKTQASSSTKKALSDSNTPAAALVFHRNVAIIQPPLKQYRSLESFSATTRWILFKARMWNP